MPIMALSASCALRQGLQEVIKALDQTTAIQVVQ